MELRLFEIIRRWSWLVVTAAVLATISAYVLVEQQPRVYQASSRLIVGPSIDGLSPDLNDLRAGGQLMQTYAELASTRPILETVIEATNLAENAESLARRITVRVDEETQILSIVVESTDPDQAAAVANAVADVLLRLSPSGGESSAAILMTQMRQQADALQQSILLGESRLDKLQADLDAATTAEEQQTLLEQMAQERARLAEARGTLALLYNALKDSPTNQVKIIESAVVGEQVARRLPLVLLTAAFAGAVLALLAVLAYEYLDQSIHFPDELRQVSQKTVLSIIPGHAGWQSNVAEEALVVRTSPQSAVAESYRTLGAKLPLSAAGAGQAGRTLAITSIEKDEDAAEIAANLAVVLAQTGNRVVLVDANLHQPAIAGAFGFSDRIGLTTMLTSHGEVGKTLSVSWTPGLTVLPSGPSIVDAFARLASPRMMDVLDMLQHQADLVIVVTSPLSTFADSLLLTSRVDGVIVSVRAGQVARQSVEDVMNSLESVGARILGTVLFQRSLSPSDRFTRLRSRLKTALAARQKSEAAAGESDQWGTLSANNSSRNAVETASRKGGATTS